MDIPRIKEHLFGLWNAIRGLKPVPQYVSMAEVLYVLRGDIHLSLRLVVVNKDALHPLLYNRENEVVGVVALPTIFAGLLEEGWVEADESGNYRPTALGLEKLAWHERTHLEAGDCPVCGKPIPFFPPVCGGVERGQDGKLHIYHPECFMARKTDIQR